MRPDSRIDPDYDPSQDEQLERITRLAMEAAARATVNINHESKEPSWRDWMMNILGGLIVVGIGAVIYQLEDLKSTLAGS